MSVDVEHFIWPSDPLEYIVRLNFVFRGPWRDQLTKENDGHREDGNTAQSSPSKKRTRKHGREVAWTTCHQSGYNRVGHSPEGGFMVHDDPTTPFPFVRSSSNAP